MTKKIIAPGFELWTGDALAILPELAPASCDALICDPPYSSGGNMRTAIASTAIKYTNRKKKSAFLSFPGDSRNPRSFAFWLTMILSAAYPALKEGAPICLFTDWRQLPSVTDVFQAAGYTWRGIYVWDKTKGARPTMGRFRNQCEYVVWGSKGEMPMDKDSHPLNGLFTCNIHKEGRYHQTGKPAGLMRDLLTITKPEAVILDPFAGSGSTGVAAAQTGRRFIGIEMTDIYSEVAINRINEALENAKESAA